MKNKGITLIGMPASGKSTIARELAKAIKYPFVDIDQWMIEREGISVKEIINQKGREYTLTLESMPIHKNELFETIISPPGSIVYTDTYEKVKSHTKVIWLKNSYSTIAARLSTDPENIRGIIGLEEHGLEKLYAQRTPLYEMWADYTLEADDKTVQEIVQEILAYLRS